MSEFKDYLTNHKYIGNYNAIISSNTNNTEKGVVYVEDGSDIWFWQTFIERLFPNQYEYKTASYEQQGKTTLKQFYKKLNKKVLIARDADYDWLLPNQDDLNNPYILHTFAYSKESVLIEKDNLNEFFGIISHSHRHNMSINTVIKHLSRLVFFGLCWLVNAYLKNSSPAGINYDSFNKNYQILDKNFVLENLMFDFDALNIIQDNVNNHLTLSSNDDLMTAKCYLSKYDINENNAYRFISGHLLDEFINKIHEQLCNQLKRKEADDIKQHLKGKAIGNRISQISKIFENSFSLQTYYRQYLIDDNDEIHQKILEKISQLNNNI